MAVLTGSVELLARAASYALGSVDAVEPRSLSDPTPCRFWDLRMLLEHVNDSLDVLNTSIESGRISPDPDGDGQPDPPADLLTAFRGRARRLLGRCTSANDHGVVVIADRSLPASIVVCTGAIELAVHGWDIFSACGYRRPIPAGLAVDMLEVSKVVVTEAIRHPLFAAPVSVSPSASPSDQLVAFLGRHPHG